MMGGPVFRRAGTWRSGKSICCVKDLSSNLQESQLEGFPLVYKVVMSQKNRCQRVSPKVLFSPVFLNRAAPLACPSFFSHCL